MAGNKKRSRPHRSSSGIDGEQFAQFPKSVIESEAFAALSAGAHRLLARAAMLYRDGNNGSIELPTTQFALYGFKNSTSMSNAVQRLKETGLLVVTRQGRGGKFTPIRSLYALGWRPIIANPAKGVVGVDDPSDRWRYFKA